ncbi:MAG: hypothetical protein JWR19_2902 [Pedosphaera sp.]|nr:hypothetical protein [Pedosphaera sp.]
MPSFRRGIFTAEKKYGGEDDDEDEGKEKSSTSPLLSRPSSCARVIMGVWSWGIDDEDERGTGRRDVCRCY